MHGEKDGIDAEIALQWNDGYAETLYSFANNINTHEGGTHLSGFRSALTRTINSYATKNNLAKDLKESVTGDDIREGLTAVISVKIPQPQFEGQTKTKLGNTEVKGIVEAIVNDKLGAYPRGESRRRPARSSARRSTRPARARRRARRAIWSAARARSTAARCPASWPTARSAIPALSELYIVEGESAGGSAKQGRDRRFQAILPLKGKILNVEKARFDKMLGSDEIKTMIAALGCGIGAEDFDIAKLRYHRIIIMTDADVDGSHIRTLLLTFFYRQLPKVIENGYIYIAQPPLFRAKRGKSETYIKDERELEAFLIKRAAEARVVRIPSTGPRDLRAPSSRSCCSKMIAHQKLLQTVERRGHPREIVEALVAAGADREYFADKDKLDALARALTTPTRTVTVQRDEEHNRYLLQVEDRSSGYPRQHTIGVDFVTAGEYRTLLANRRDIPAFAGDIIVSTAAGAAGRGPRSAASRERRRRRDRQGARRREGRAGRRAPALARRARRLLHRRRQEGRRHQPLQGPRRDEPGAALGDDDGSGGADAAAGARRGSHRSRPDVHDADGRSGRAAPEVHRRQRARRQEPRRVRRSCSALSRPSLDPAQH